MQLARLGVVLLLAVALSAATSLLRRCAIGTIDLSSAAPRWC